MAAIFNQISAILKDIQKFIDHELKFIADNHGCYETHRPPIHLTKPPPTQNTTANAFDGGYSSSCELEAHEIAIIENDVPFLTTPSSNTKNPAYEQQRETERRAAICRLVFGYDKKIDRLKSEIENLKRQSANIQTELAFVDILNGSRITHQMRPLSGETEVLRTGQRELVEEVSFIRRHLDSRSNKQEFLKMADDGLMNANKELPKALEPSLTSYESDTSEDCWFVV